MITIVVLLILAGVSIAMLGGDNGIVTQAQKAKEQTTIAKEKESISLAKGAIRSRGEEVGKDNLQEELDRIEGEGKTEVTLKEDLSGLEIKFIDTDNKYEEGVTIEVSEEEQSYWTYEDNPDGTITLLKYNPPAENLSGLTELVVPNKIFGKRVKCVGSGNFVDTIWGDNISERRWFGSAPVNGQFTVEKILIQENIEKINNFAFLYSEKVEDIIILEGVASIGAKAFECCSRLTNIDLPDSVTSIGERVFSDCSSLTSVNIPDGVTSIGDSAFLGCSSITSINIPDSVTSIGDRAFSGCSSITGINIPDSVTSIGEYAFSGCSSLTSITVSENNSNYDSRNDCNAIIETGTNKLILGCSKTNIPDSVTSIGDGAFSGCSSLTGINIPGSVTSIGWRAFSDCSSLTTINLEASEIPSTWHSQWKGNCTATVNTGVKM